jgi:hypothetical protein
VKEFGTYNVAERCGRSEDVPLRRHSFKKKLTMFININNMILFSDNEFGNGSLIVESWLAV